MAASDMCTKAVSRIPELHGGFKLIAKNQSEVLTRWATFEIVLLQN